MYTLKVWLTSVFFPPIVFFVMFLTDPVKTDILGYIMLMVLLGAVLSLPSAALLGFSIYILKYTELSVKQKKIILSIIGIVLTIAPFLFFIPIDSILDIGNPLVFAYALVIVAGIWFYKMEQENVPVEAETAEQFI